MKQKVKQKTKNFCCRIEQKQRLKLEAHQPLSTKDSAATNICREMINLGAIAIPMAVSGCGPQLVDCSLLALNIFDFKLAPSLICACDKAAAIPPLWHHAGCHLAGSVASEKLFLSQTFLFFRHLSLAPRQEHL